MRSQRKLLSMLITLAMVLTMIPAFGVTASAADKVSCNGYWCTSGLFYTSVELNGKILAPSDTISGLTPGETATLKVKAINEHYAFLNAFLRIEDKNGNSFKLSMTEDGMTAGVFTVPEKNFVIGIEVTSLQYDVIYDDGVNIVGEFYYDYDTTVTVKDINEFTMSPPGEGYVFAGWKDESDQKMYVAGDTFTADNKSARNGKDLTAQWINPSESSPTHKVSIHALNVREGPGQEYSRIGGLTEGKGVTVIETQGEWSEILYNTGFGWVQSKYLKEIEKEIYTVRFDANGGSGLMSDMTVKEGEKLTLPECAFIPPEGKTFDRWIAGYPGEQVEVGGDSIIRAFWKDDPLVNPFVDIYESDDYYNAVLWAYYANPQITNGMDETHFGPHLTVTRGQAVTFLWRAMGCPEPSSLNNPFVDVPSGEWFYKPVFWAVEKGITRGVDETHFNPSDTLSTQHMVTFLYRTAYPGQDGWDGEAAAWGADENGRPFGVDIAVNNTTPCPRCRVVQFLYD